MKPATETVIVVKFKVPPAGIHWYLVHKGEDKTPDSKCYYRMTKQQFQALQEKQEFPTALMEPHSILDLRKQGVENSTEIKHFKINAYDPDSSLPVSVAICASLQELVGKLSSASKSPKVGADNSQKSRSKTRRPRVNKKSKSPKPKRTRKTASNGTENAKRDQSGGDLQPGGETVSQ